MSSPRFASTRSQAHKLVRATSRRMHLESLESRELFAVGGDFTFGEAAAFKYEPANASSANGMSVVVWAERYSATDWDIKARLFDAAGTRRGEVISVTSSTKMQHQPAVAMDADGDFVVAWTEDYTASDWNIRAQRFSASGAKVGTEIAVDSDTRKVYDPSIAMDAAGNFIVSYTQDYSSTDQDIRARRYDNTGRAITGSFAVANSSTSKETASSVAMTDDGRFIIAYQFNNDIFLKRYSASGTLLNALPVAANTVNERAPSVAMDASGNGIIVWQQMVGGDDDIKSRRISNTGVLGSTTTVRASSDFEQRPSVALSRTGDRFVVAYETYALTSTGAISEDIKITEVLRQSGVDAVQRTVSLGGKDVAGVSMDGNNQYFVSYVQFGGLEFGRWGRVSAAAPTDKLAHDFEIDVRFLGTGWTASQKALIRQAADRWEEVILGDLVDVNFNGEVIDDIVIEASIAAIDGVNSTLADASFDQWRPGSHMPFHGLMRFDSADLVSLSSGDGRDLVDVAAHEMAHAIGIGTLWSDRGLITGAGTADPRFTGAQAVAEFNAIFGRNDAGVPVENAGGGGSLNAHWRDAIFGGELMSSNLSAANPISRITVASLADMGYVVNMAAADAYTPPRVIFAFATTTTTGAGSPAIRRESIRTASVPVNQTVSISHLAALDQLFSSHSRTTPRVARPLSTVPSLAAVEDLFSRLG